MIGALNDEYEIGAVGTCRQNLFMTEPQPANRLDVYMVSLKICIEGHVAPRPRACGGPRRGRAPQSDRGPRTPQRAWPSNRTRLKSEIVRGVRRA